MRIARVDDNQAGIVKALREVGATVTPTHMVGRGFPDLVVGYRGANFLLEVKDGAKAPSARKLTPAELDWHDAWRRTAHVVDSVKAALVAVGALRGEVS